MIRVTVLGLAVAVSGCTISPALQRGSEETVRLYRAANADLSQSATAWLCRGMSIYEWTQRYGDNLEKARAWRTLCQDEMVKALPSIDAESP